MARPESESPVAVFSSAEGAVGTGFSSGFCSLEQEAAEITVRAASTMEKRRKFALSCFIIEDLQKLMGNSLPTQDKPVPSKCNGRIRNNSSQPFDSPSLRLSY